jgi:hypothetical protein
MNIKKFAILSAAAILVGTASYFILEGVSLCRKNKKAKSLKSSII